jgi:L-amino acid N-acyltransferase YncA
MLTIVQTYAHGFILAYMLDIYINLFRVYTYTVKVSIYVGPREILRTIQYALIVSALPTMKLAFRETRQDLKGRKEAPQAKSQEVEENFRARGALNEGGSSLYFLPKFPRLSHAIV